MYADNVRNRLLIVIMTVLMLTSTGVHIQQFTDIGYYKKVALEAQLALEALADVIHLFQPVTPAVVTASIPTPVISPAPPNNVKPVNKDDLRCLSENIYFEAGNQSLVGKMAVGQVVLNRMHSGRYPRTVCGVINQTIDGHCQFSWKCEEAKPIRNNSAWKQSQQVAYELLSKDRKDIMDITEGATHFHNARVRPGWKLKFVTKIDDHLFYK